MALQIPIIGRSAENQYGSLLYDDRSVTVSALDVAALDIAALIVALPFVADAPQDRRT